MRSWRRRRSGGGLWPLLNGTERRILCWVTDRLGLAGDFGGSAGTEPLLESIRWAIDAGVDWIQIREKDLGGGRLAELARGAVAAGRVRNVEAGSL